MSEPLAGKLYGEKCLKCTHVRHDNREIELRWPAADDDCQDCYECQEDAFWGALIRMADDGTGNTMFSPEVREAREAWRWNRPHPLIDRLRAECQAIEAEDE